MKQETLPNIWRQKWQKMNFKPSRMIHWQEWVASSLRIFFQLFKPFNILDCYISNWLSNALIFQSYMKDYEQLMATREMQKKKKKKVCTYIFLWHKKMGDYNKEMCSKRLGNRNFSSQNLLNFRKDDPEQLVVMLKQAMMKLQGMLVNLLKI